MLSLGSVFDKRIIELTVVPSLKYVCNCRRYSEKMASSLFDNMIIDTPEAL